MLKKIFSRVGVICLVVFSFYYTDLAASIIKGNDPIMKELKNSKSDYEKVSKNALINDNSIIPGTSGVGVDINSSYEAMKRYGSYNDSLIVFNEVSPTISISNVYDKYITSGNESRNLISFVFVINNYSYVTEILNILNAKGIKSTFFIDKDIMEDSFDLIKLLNNNNQEIELYSNDYNTKDIKAVNRLLKKNNMNNLLFCYSEKDSSLILDTCSKNKMHTIIPSIITSDYPYSDIKENVKNGSIIKLINNKETLRELKYIINYVIQKGYAPVTLKDLIKE